MFLLWGVVENCRAILGAEVGALPVQLGWIVVFPKDVKQLFIRNFGRVVIHFHRFGMPGAIGADVFVGGILHLTPGVADASSGHAWNLAESSLNTPKTSCRESSFSHNQSSSWRRAVLPSIYQLLE